MNKGKFSGIGTFGIGFGSTFSQIETELSKIASPPYPSPLFLGIGIAIMLAGATVGMHYKISFLVYAGVVIGSLASVELRQLNFEIGRVLSRQTRQRLGAVALRPVAGRACRAAERRHDQLALHRADAGWRNDHRRASPQGPGAQDLRLCAADGGVRSRGAPPP
mgnify:CR=1 FL=1